MDRECVYRIIFRCKEGGIYYLAKFSRQIKYLVLSKRCPLYSCARTPEPPPELAVRGGAPGVVMAALSLF